MTLLQQSDGDLSGFVQSRFEVDRAHDRFKRVGEQGGFFPSFVVLFGKGEVDIFAQPQLFCQPCKAAFVDKGGTDLGEGTFVGFGESGEEILADDEVEYGISEKFKPLIIVRLLVTLVCQSLNNQLLVFEGIAKFFFKLTVVVHGSSFAWFVGVNPNVYLLGGQTHGSAPTKLL